MAPSMLAADFARLSKKVAEAEKAGADRIHVDVMDGHAVPNLSTGAPIGQSLRRVTHLPLEMHLMISDADFFLEQFADAGSSDLLLVHWEGNDALHRTVQRVRTLGQTCGRGHQPGNPHGRTGGNPARRRAGVGHDGQRACRISAVHRHDPAKNRTCPSDD